MVDAYKKDALKNGPYRVAREENTEIVREIFAVDKQHAGMKITQREMDLMYLTIKICRKLLKHQGD